MAEIHRTSIVDPQATLASDVEVGPGCVIDGAVTVGAATRLVGHVYLVGPLTIGEGNVIYPHACIGFDPQHRHFDSASPGGGSAQFGQTVASQSETRRS